jgi:heptosyltransferase-1
MKIAIVKLSALGDIVHAMVALQFIKAQSADISIDWVVEERFVELLQFNPDIDRILTVNLKALKANPTAIVNEIKKVRGYAKKNYSLVMDAQGLLKSAITARLLGRRCAGFDSASIREKAASWLYDVKVHSAYDNNTIDRNALALSRPLALGISKEQILEKKPFLFYQNEDPQLQQYLSKDRANIVLVIGSTWASRNYPVEHYLSVAQALKQNCLVIWGNEEERTKAEWMASQSEYVTVLPKLDLNNLKALIDKSDLTIGNDTGPTHMAWGLNKPSITLFGPTPVSRIYQTDINKALKSPSVVNPLKLNKQDFSIVEIKPEQVIELAESILNATSFKS